MVGEVEGKREEREKAPRVAGRREAGRDLWALVVGVGGCGWMGVCCEERAGWRAGMVGPRVCYGGTVQ